MPKTNTPVLTEENKEWIKNNSHMFTAKEMADYFNVYPQIISGYCRHHGLPIKKGVSNGIVSNSDFFNVKKYLNSTATI